ncbi:MAG TPA: DUF1444 family protein [Bacteroidia bacterium]|nr:DUF1444 family protein [Chitinophagales bacterium]HNL05160.1 DUF1444 family protein [Bacteroidia bacterium]
MGFFKRIFGAGDDSDTKRVADTVSKIESGEVNKIYPILKPGDWVGIKYGAIKQTLLGTDDSPELVIGYGYDGPNDFIFITHDMLQDKTVELVYQEATKNLAEYDTPIKEVVAGKVVICDGADFCSEKILNTAFMLDLHKRLDAKELLVSIPRRRNMMVTSRQAEPAILNQFMNVHLSTWDDDSYGNAPIINLLFVVVNGEINGVIRLDNAEK